MYGYEAATGLGGLAAQAPPNPRMAGALLIRSPGSMLAGDASSGGGSPLPYDLSGNPLGGLVSATGTGVTQPQSTQLGNWREILDPHNSPAVWVLILLLIAYGYVHVSYRRGRVSAGGGL